LYGENKISNEHIRNNSRVRKVLLEDNIIPEELPPEKDIKKLHKKIKKSEKQLFKK
jgi:DNA-damage-inducible protein D